LIGCFHYCYRHSMCNILILCSLFLVPCVESLRILTYQKSCIVEHTVSDRLKFLFSGPCSFYYAEPLVCHVTCSIMLLLSPTIVSTHSNALVKMTWSYSRNMLKHVEYAMRQTSYMLLTIVHETYTVVFP